MLWFALVLYALFLIFQLLYMFIPLFQNKKHYPQQRDDALKSVSILIPAFNEEKVIKYCLSGILNSHAQHFEAIFINDGSSDRTFHVLKKALKLVRTKRQLRGELNYQTVKAIYQSKRYPYLYVIDKENGGKADALNAGVDYAKHELVVTLDADSVLAPDAIVEMQQAFIDPKVIAAGGVVHIGQGMRGKLPTFSLSGLLRFQVLQYLTAFYLHKHVQSKLGAITVIAGAFGTFKKSALIAVGGYRRTVGEDMDITLKIQQLIKKTGAGEKLIFVPKATCFTECPSTFSDLFNQRMRWQKAFIDCVITYRYRFFRQMKCLPSLYLLLDSLLLGTVNAFFMIFIPFTLLIYQTPLIIPLTLGLISLLMACYQSIVALVVSGRFGFRYRFRDYIRIGLFIPFEVVSYRLLGILFVICGTFLYFRNRESWHVSRRVGQLQLEEGVL
ncbi:glycosyltransferase family 2 protein [Amphibacillus cookii]|uniref:glycosyltransferase family 2 protein n=1 Tax=Amphibacillus cookii TaxID=767787 RepID=UPI00195A43D3|nr:glycosyltransferase family 2 protein [Amphibacillus cookii]MBM7539856.1 cellulose synthase/poly-beta-1,6-N-acetylglucosamine synthase-like glycosyltransferase [Amphibacillus cookii]